MTDMNQRMADAIKNRRLELGLDLPSFIAATGLTRQGLAPLLAGEERRYQERLTLPVTRVLRWTPDSIERLLAGKEPIPNGTDEPALVARMDGLATRLAELAARIEQLQDQFEDLLHTGVRNQAQTNERIGRLEGQGEQSGDDPPPT